MGDLMNEKEQFGVIPYTNGKKGIKVILVTSKTNGYWIFPKGNPIKNLTSFQSDQQEAFEEGGVKGKLDSKRSYSVSFTQHRIPYKLTLYPMKVEELLSSWPEMEERRRKQVSVEKALELLNYDGLQKCLRDWVQEKQG